MAHTVAVAAEAALCEPGPSAQAQDCVYHDIKGAAWPALRPKPMPIFGS